MPEPVANDYATIAARWREIAEEKRAAMSACEHCEGAGWVRSSVAMYANVWVVCGECLNALDRPQPG